MQLFHNQITNAKHRKDILLVLDEVHTPYNIGLLLRTAEAMGVKKIFVISDIFNELSSKIKKLTRSVEKEISVYFFDNRDACLQKIPPEYRIYALEKTSKSKDYYQGDFSFPCVVVCGNERRGVSDFWLSLAKEHYHIDMYGKNTSMNVAVATGIFLSHLIRV